MRRWTLRLAFDALGGAALLACGCVTHDLNAVDADGRVRADVVPPGVRRLHAESPLSIAAGMDPSRAVLDEANDSGDSLVPPLFTRRERRGSSLVEQAAGTAPLPEPTSAFIRPAGQEVDTAAPLDRPASQGAIVISYEEQRVAEGETLPIPPDPNESLSGAPSRRQASAPPATPGFARISAEAAVVPVDLSTALSMTAGQNPQVAFARERVEEAMAQVSAAEALWLPSIRVGGNYNKHEGRIQDVAGRVFETSRVASFGGLGARGVGAGSPTIPGLAMQFAMADAVFQPKIAERRSQALDRSAKATLNDELLETALAYLDLLDALQSQAIASETVQHSEELARLTADFARAGEGTEADANRAATNLATQRNRRTGSDAAVVTASARLAQQIRLNPACLLAPSEANVAPVCLVDTRQPVKDLIATGLGNRPELAANRHFVDEAIERLKREKYSIWLPSVLVGMDYGGMGGGFNNEIVNSGERFDFDAVAYWEVRNLGFGEKAARDQARSRVDQARFRQLEAMDTIVREIVQFHAQAEAATAQIDVARGAVTSAREAYARDLSRIREAQGLPIETLQSLLALDAAQREYLRATIEHNRAQFQLQRALGWPVH
ncbi:MAG: TolC family protein [Planctomycetaceae bacterium]|nr:TolC family protein [Planctomycetaceae bacterium]